MTHAIDQALIAVWISTNALLLGLVFIELAKCQRIGLDRVGLGISEIFLPVTYLLVSDRSHPRRRNVWPARCGVPRAMAKLMALAILGAALAGCSV